MGLGRELAREAPRRGWLVAVLMLGLVVGGGCGGGDDDQASPSELRALLVPAAIFPVQVQRRFEWDDPMDFSEQGLSLPGDTEPSEAAAVIDRAGFETGVGQLLAPPAIDIEAYTEVAKFESEEGARTALDYLHAQDLLEPCSAACPVVARSWDVVGIPNAKGAHHAPVEGSPSPSGAAAPYERYVIEFAIGRHLLIGRVTGPPGLVPAPQFMDGVESFYEHARRRLR